MRMFILIAGLIIPIMGFAAGGGATYPKDKIDIDWSDKASMQRGAQTFMNYCLSCHSAAYSRFNRVAADLEIPEDVLIENLIFTTDSHRQRTKVGELMKATMTDEYAEAAFGTVPPDLSLIARSRGVDWLYNYLRGFYVDETRPLGMNNSVFDKVGMPHVLVELQGYQRPVIRTSIDEKGDEHTKIVGFEIIQPGSLSKSEYDQTVYDLVAFLDYLSEPYRETRHAVGKGVLFFLFIFMILAYMLKREFWKDIH
ncbi:MAG: ubiquinol-cytochrome c reductase cytochrome c1 subunit [Gammaproteobacteria bacterium]|jgi:ubiquinol-cytochrome c reductase cytochrome c1 subunit